MLRPLSQLHRFVRASMLFVAVFVAVLFVVVQPPAFADDSKPAAGAPKEGVSLTQALPRDPNNVYGKFDNGFSYIIRKHTNPPERAAFFLHVDTGALNETPKQNGMAHFLEHMAFNGSKNFKPGELIPYMNDLGMQFGSDSNAHTSQFETVYKLFMPKNSAEMTDKAMTILSDYAYGLLLLDEEIEKERSVILEEMRSRKGVQQRIRDALMPKLYAGSRMAEHTVIGLAELIETFPRSEFLDYYNTWYRPERMTLIVVGDIDPKEIIAKAQKAFGTFKGRAPARQEQGTGVKPVKASRAFVMTDPELPMGIVQMVSIQEGRPPMKSLGEFRENEVENIGTQIVSKRLQERLQRGEASYMFASASVTSLSDDAIQSGANVGGQPDSWEKGLAEVIEEMKRAIEHGFTERELELVKKSMIAGAERRVSTEPTVAAAGMMNRINAAVGSEQPLMSAQQRLDSLRSVIDSITVEEVQRRFVTNYADQGYTYVVILPEQGTEAPSKEKILEVAKNAWGKKSEKAAEEDAGNLTLLEKEPESGKIASQTTDKELGITTVRFENGAVLHHRFMDYNKDQVSIAMSAPGGSIQESIATKGLSDVASLSNATSRLSSIQIRDLMTGKKARASGGMGFDTINFSIGGSPADLEDAFRLAHALITDARIEKSAFDTWKTSVQQSIEQAKSDVGAQLRKAIAETFQGGDVRFRELTEADLEKVSIDRAHKWMRSNIDGAPMEIAVVGEISLERTLELAGRYLASLPKATRGFDAMDSLRKVERPAGPYTKRVEFESVTPQALVLAGYVGCDHKNKADRRRLSLAARIITDRMTKEIREEKGLVYSIGCQNAPSRTVPGMGMFYAAAPTAPEKASQLADTILAMLQKFAQEGPTDEELEVAKKQIQANLDEEMKKPGFWLSVMRDLVQANKDLADIKELKAYYAAMTKEHLQETAAKYFTPERVLRYEMIPTAPKTEPKE
ncbi:MAG: insulinase family protein [Planctomycetota bacterium]